MHIKVCKNIFLYTWLAICPFLYYQGTHIDVININLVIVFASDCVHIDGNLFFKVLNLFLALLLSSFGASNLSQAPSDTADTKKLQEAIDRFTRFFNFIRRQLLRLLKVSYAYIKPMILQSSRNICTQYLKLRFVMKIRSLDNLF